MAESVSTDRRWKVYIVRCRDGSLYTGIATDVARRMQEHRCGVAGSKYLRGRAPLELVCQWAVGNRSLASRIEHRIKRLKRSGKESLVADPAGIAAIITAIHD